MGQEKCTATLGLLESYIDETEDGISLLNAQVSNVKYREVFSIATKLSCLNKIYKPTSQKFRKFSLSEGLSFLDSIVYNQYCHAVEEVTVLHHPQKSLPREPSV